MSLITSLKQDPSKGAGKALVIYLVCAVPLYAWNGFVIKTVWNWFVPTVFESAPSIGILQAIGLGIVVSIMTYRRVATSNKEESLVEGMIQNIFGEFAIGVVALAIGLIIHLLM